MSVKVRQRGDTYWIFADHRGRRKAKKVAPGRAGKQLAEQLAKQWSAWITLGKTDKVFMPVTIMPATVSTLPTLRFALPPWIDRRAKAGELRGSSPHAYHGVTRTWIVNHALFDSRLLGDLPVDQITREMLGSVLTAIKDAGRTRSTVEHARKVLRGFFRELVETKQLPVNPAADLAYFVGRMSGGRRIGIFSKEECRVLLRATEETRWHAFLATALGTGCRWGELCALTRDDVDLDRGRVHVRQSWSLRAGAVQPPKNGRSRYIPTPAELVTVLRAQVEQRAAEGWGEAALVFPGPDGRHLRSWHAIWSGLLKRAGLTFRPFHCLRHSFASHALRAGVRPELVQRFLGHSQLSMTLDVYREFVPDHASDAADAAKLGELLG